MNTKDITATCPDCGVPPGQLHEDDCDVERCPICRGQLLTCDCDVSEANRQPWTGEWPVSDQPYEHQQDVCSNKLI